MRILRLDWQHNSGRRDGGSARITAFDDAIQVAGAISITAPIPQASTALTAGPLLRAVGRVKRHYLPMSSRQGATLVDPRLVERALPDLIVTSLPPLADYVIGLDIAPVWTDFHDSWSEFAKREANFARGLARRTRLRQARGLADLEVRVVEGSARATFAGYSDWEAFRGIGSTGWLPTPVELAGLQGGGGRREVAGFLGNFSYGPNLDAVEYLVRKWLPSLEAAGFRVVIGGYGSAGLKVPDSVECLGALESVADFYDMVDVVLVPVRRGGGIKAKAIEAIAAGRPVLVDPHVLLGFAPEFRELMVPWPRLGELPDPDPRLLAVARERFSQRSFERQVAEVLVQF